MSHIPIYLKTSSDMPRPTEAEFYWVTANGTFLGRNHPFFTSEVLAQKPPRALAEHRAACTIRYPRLGMAALEYIVGFFDRVYELHGSESIVLLYWDLVRKRYRLVVPPQTATVWETSSGSRSALDVAYETPTAPPKNCLLVADIHCHGDYAAYSSYTDEKDEIHRDGVHAIVGRIHREPPEFHLEIAVDGSRFGLQFDHFFSGYERRRRDIPQAWLDQVKVKVDRPSPPSRNYSSTSYYDDGYDSSKWKEDRWR
ncbi:MAG: hypothetical protein AB7O62_09270 [Pirellulales bacterium]